MHRESRHAVAAVAALCAASAALLQLAWPPGLPVSGLPTAVTTESPAETLPLLLALALCVFSVWLAGAMLSPSPRELPGTAGRWSRAALRRVAPAAVRHLLRSRSA